MVDFGRLAGPLILLTISLVCFFKAGVLAHWQKQRLGDSWLWGTRYCDEDQLRMLYRIGGIAFFLIALWQSQFAFRH